MTINTFPIPTRKVDFQKVIDAEGFSQDAEAARDQAASSAELAQANANDAKVYASVGDLPVVTASDNGTWARVLVDSGVQAWLVVAGAWAFQAWLEGPHYDDVSAFFASTDTFTDGTYVRTRAEGFAYRAVDSGGHVQNSATTPQEFEALPGGNGVFHVDAFGAKGDGLNDDQPAIEAAITADTGGEVIFRSAGIYLQERQINCYGRDVIINGNGATLKRGDALYTPLASDYSGGTTVDVADSAGFAVGDRIILTDTTASYGGRANTETSQSPQEITSISGNTLTIESPVDVPPTLSGTAPASTTRVLLVYAQIHQSENSRLSIYDLIVDGNRASYDPIYQGWRTNQTITRISNGGIVSGCTFKNIPSECIYLGYWATVTNNNAYNLNGSFTHTSSATSHLLDPSGLNIISDNRISRAGEVSRDISTHSEGVFTWSANAGKILITNNAVENCGNALTGKIGNIGETIIANNLCKNLNGVLYMRPFSNRFKNIVITDNVFDSCLWLAHEPNATFVNKDLGTDVLTIKGNQFLNTKVFLREVSNFNISDNLFIQEADFDPGVVTWQHLESQESFLFLIDTLNYTVSDNIFEDRKLVSGTIKHGIEWTGDDRIQSASGVGSNYTYYNRNVKIANNQFVNVNNGLHNDNPKDSSFVRSFMAFHVIGNSFFLRDESGSEYAIRALPGMIIQNNIIYAGANTTYGIDMKRGLVALSSKDDINGPVAIGNTIMGNPTYSIRVGAFSGAADKNWNGVAVNNLVCKNVTIDSAIVSQNTVSGNVTMLKGTEEYEYQPSRAHPEWY